MSFSAVRVVVRLLALAFLVAGVPARLHAQACATATVTNFNVSAPNLQGQGVVEVGWQFAPTTCCNPYLKLHIEGPNFFAEEQLHTYSGQKSFAYNVSCMAPGTYPFTAWVGWQSHDCGITSAIQTRPITVSNLNEFALVNLRKLPSTAKIEAKIQYNFPPTGGRDLKLYLTSWRDDDGVLHTTPQLLASTTAQQANGTWVYEFTPPSSARWVQVRATGSRCTGESESYDALDCPECSAQAGDPVSMVDGTMTYTETDPLPGMMGEGGLRRVYLSSEGAKGVFGHGWFSIFDRMLATTPSSAGHAVTISTASDQFVTFTGPVGGPYTQATPRSSGSLGTLKYDAASSVYEYRGPGATIVSRYSASGRFVGWRDLASGRQTTITYGNALPVAVADSWSGLTWTITTDAISRRITSISIANSPSILWEYVYDSAGLLESVQVNSDTWREYVYANGLLTEVRDPLDNLIESHTYDSYGRATSSHGPSDEITLIEYDQTTSSPDEALTRVTAATGAITEFVLRSEGTIWRPLKISGGCASCGARDSVYAYDREGRVVRQQDASGYVTVSSYGSDGQLASTQVHLKPTGCDPATDSNQCRFDPASLAIAVLEPTGATFTTTYKREDPLWPDKITMTERPSVAVPGQLRTQTWSFHPVTGDVVNSTLCGWVPNGTSCSSRTTTTTLYEGGSLTPAFDPGGTFQSSWLALAQPALMPRSTDGPRTDLQDITSFVYYPIDTTVPGLLRGRLAATKNAAGHITRYEDYDAFGNIRWIVDANEVATEITYDVLGRLLTSTVKAVPGCDTGVDPLCASDITSVRTYTNGVGDLRAEFRPAGGVTIYEYDARGRLYRISRGPSETDLRERIETNYGETTGKKDLERTLAYESGSWVEKRREAFTHDTRARLASIVHADDSAIHYFYDSADRVGAMQDENHNSPNTHYAYDSAGRMKASTQVLTGASGGVIVTSYDYDVAGNRTSVTDPNGNVTTYQYDDFEQVRVQSSPVTGSTVHEYDEAGNLTESIDANGATTTRTYDELGRALVVTSSRSGLGDEVVTNTYDDNAAAFGVGRRIDMTGPSGTTTYRYQRQGRIASEHRVFGGTTYTTSYQYDGSGGRTYIGYPYMPGVTYTFDFAGRPLTAEFDLIGRIIDSAAYLPFGPLSELHFSNSVVQRFGYDGRYQPQSNRVSLDTATIASYAYGHDLAGNITQILDETNPGYDRSILQYDDLNRLVGTTTGSELWGSSSYVYDAMGNMLSMEQGLENDSPEPGLGRGVSSQNLLKRRTAFKYEGTTSKLKHVEEWGVCRPVTYDSAGNEISAGATRTYSARNLLTKIEDWPEDGAASHMLEYGYDGRGIRVRQTESPAYGPGTSSTRYFIYSPELQLLTVTAPSDLNSWHDWGGKGKQIVWFGNRPVASVATSMLTPPEDFFFFESELTIADHLGTPIMQLNWGEVTWRAEYEPFGNVHEMRTGVRDAQPLRLPGQEVTLNWDGYEENYNIFRWYRSGWGRYTQADPIGLKGGLNLYGYVEGNPLRFADPRGLVKWMCDYGYVSGEVPGAGVLGGAFGAKCTSECAKGKKVEAYVIAGVGGLSFLSPVPFTISYSQSTELNDPFSTPSAKNLEGAVAVGSAGVALGGGLGCTVIGIGSAFGYSCSGQYGVGLGIDAFAGAGGVVQSKEWCCKE